MLSQIIIKTEGSDIKQFISTATIEQNNSSYFIELIITPTKKGNIYVFR